MGEGSISRLARALKPMKSGMSPVILTISLRSTFLSSKMIQNLADALRVNKTLTSIDFSHNCIKDYDGKKLISSLNDNQTLKEVDLSSNLLGEKSCLAISEILSSNEIIEIIDISHNPVRSDFE